MTSLVMFILFLQFLVVITPRALLGHEILSLSPPRPINQSPPLYPDKTNPPPRALRAAFDQSRAAPSLPLLCADNPRFGRLLHQAKLGCLPSFHPELPSANPGATVYGTNSWRWQTDTLSPSP